MGTTSPATCYLNIRSDHDIEAADRGLSWIALENVWKVSEDF